MVHLIHLVGLVYGHSYVAQRDWQGATSLGPRAASGVATVEYVRATTTSVTTVSVKTKGTELNYIALVVA